MDRGTANREERACRDPSFLASGRSKHIRASTLMGDIYALTFNQGVAGSIPAALTKEINYLIEVEKIDSEIADP
jgi:hypothetical protein